MVVVPDAGLSDASDARPPIQGAGRTILAQRMREAVNHLWPGRSVLVNTPEQFLFKKASRAQVIAPCLSGLERGGELRQTLGMAIMAAF